MTLDLLLDLSDTPESVASIREAVEYLARPDGLGAITGRASCILPQGIDAFDSGLGATWQFAPAGDWWAMSNCALEAAARHRRHLLVALQPLLAGNEPISTLVEALEADPMFGFAAARVAGTNGELTKLARSLGDPEIEWLPRAVLAGLPPYYIVPELVGSCFVLRREVVANFGELSAGFRSAAGAWLEYLCRARRAGFRGAIVNGAVVESAARRPAAAASPAPEDYWDLHRQYPDAEYARQEFNRLPAHENETFLARASSGDPASRKSLLLDARGMPPYHNGTASCILGLLDGFTAAAPGWHISVLAKPEAVTFHKLPQRYPAWTLFDKLPHKRFSLALRLSQPWDIGTLIELHSRALFNFYLMLDTISWDILYNGPVGGSIETAWRFMADHADGILYISDFSRQRFAARFPSCGETAQYVSYLSFHPDDYVPPAPQPPPGEGYLLVAGNPLDHKWVVPAVELLSTAFPFQSIRALGCESVHLPNVTGVPSGGLTHAQFGQLVAGARIVVFPSFYEGFGFPVVTGLSYGKPVVARRSTLLEEIAARSRPGGRLYAFSDPMELMEIVARLLGGADEGALPLGLGLKPGEEPMRWPDVARNMLGFMEQALGNPGSSQWMRRARDLTLRRDAKP